MGRRTDACMVTKIRILAHAELNDEAIASVVGRHWHTVYAIRNKYGIVAGRLPGGWRRSGIP